MCDLTDGFFFLILSQIYPRHPLFPPHPGELPPGQVAGVFGFYLVTMFLFGAIGVACSSFFQKTGASTVAAYGTAFVLSAGTGFLAVFLHELDSFNRQEAWTPDFTARVVQFLQDINPVFVLMRILGERGIEPAVSLGLPYWAVYTVFYLTGGLLLLWWSARLISPGKKSRLFKYR